MNVGVFCDFSVEEKRKLFHFLPTFGSRQVQLRRNRVSMTLLTYSVLKLDRL